jgi:3-isopropylmalate/(R)-2-methylmalate dehydratase small subunit
MMDPITRITGKMAPLPGANIDTDQILPHRFLKRVERSGFGQFLFRDWAHDSSGRPDPAFGLNQPQYRDATVLVTGPNFGCGSSREHAPWGLQDHGFAAIIAPSFADIFRANCHKIGLLAVELPEPLVGTLSRLAETDPTVEVRIDLESQTVTAPGVETSFHIEPYVRHSLMHGLDEIGATLELERFIIDYEQKRSPFLPSLPTQPWTGR